MTFQIQVRQIARRPEWVTHMDYKWFDPEDYGDGDELKAEIDKWALKSDLVEQWVIDDYTGHAGVELDTDDLDELVELGDAINDTYLDYDALCAVAEHESWEARDLIDNIEDAYERYQGYYDSEENFAKEQMEESYYSELRNLPDVLKDAIDWEGVWENEYSSYCTAIYHGGVYHVFRDS